MTYTIRNDNHVLTIAVAGVAPPGSAGFRWAKPAIAAFEKALNEAGDVQQCIVDFSHLEYIWGDFIMFFIIPATVRKIPTTAIGNESIAKAFTTMARGFPDFSFQLMA